MLCRYLEDEPMNFELLPKIVIVLRIFSVALRKSVTQLQFWLIKTWDIKIA